MKSISSYAKNFKNQAKDVGVFKTAKGYVSSAARAVNNKIADAADRKTDMEICGVDLSVYVPTKFKETFGATGSQATRYPFLQLLFRNSDFTENDSFIDIGCGKGRVLSFMIKSGFKGKITGIELDPDVAAFAKKWTDKYENVNLICGNAFDLNLNDYTVFYMFRPMENDVFEKFIAKLESELVHPIKFYFLTDYKYIYGREGWDIIKGGFVYKINHLKMYSCPQRCSVWKFTPKSLREK